MERLPGFSYTPMKGSFDRTRCATCGESTCIALAAHLIFGKRRIGDCPRLSEAEFARNRSLLAESLEVEE